MRKFSSFFKKQDLAVDTGGESVVKCSYKNPERRCPVAFDENIEKIEGIIGYSFRDRSLLRQAFTRTSWCNEQNGRGRVRFQSSEVLEFIGDSALSTAIITLLMSEESKRYEHGLSTEFCEGDFSNIKAALSNKHNLAISTKKLGLEKYLIVGEGDERLGIRLQPSVMEDLFESIIGAIYVDSDMKLEPVIAAVSRMLDVSVYKSDGGQRAINQSAKNRLQEFCAHKSRRLPQPVYVTLEENGPEHNKSFLRGCYIGDRLCGRGIGKNQKLADAAAAEDALAKLSLESAVSATDKEATEQLRSLCVERRVALPSYADLGETGASTPQEKEFEVECSALGKSARGIGKSKKEARADAAANLLAIL